MSLGAARAGFSVVASVDNDHIALAAHSKNFQECSHFHADLTQAIPTQLVDLLSPFDDFGIIGGPPCQGFSTIGKQDPADPRNLLFKRFFDIVSRLKPAFFVAENVPNILSDRFSDVRLSALASLKNSYSLIDPFLLKGDDYGAATNRERAFFVGFRSDVHKHVAGMRITPNKRPPINVRLALHGLHSSRDYKKADHNDSGWRKIRRVNESHPFYTRAYGKIPRSVGDPTHIRLLSEGNLVHGFWPTTHSPDVISRFRNTPPGSTDPISRAHRLHLDGVCPTIRAGTGRDKGAFQAVRPIHPTQGRVINPREAARLQGFPDWFFLGDNKYQCFRRIGNSVCPLIAESLLTRVAALLARSGVSNAKAA